MLHTQLVLCFMYIAISLRFYAVACRVIYLTLYSDFSLLAHLMFISQVHIA